MFRFRRVVQKHPLVSALALLIVIGTVWIAILGALPHHRSRTGPVHIPRGASILEIAAILEEEDVVPSRVPFLVFAVVRGHVRDMKLGTYDFPQNLTPWETVHILVSGEHQLERWVTIPEGWTSRRIAARLQNALGIDSARFLRMIRDPALLRALGVQSSSLEGYLYPDSYLFILTDSLRTIIRHMHSSFRTALPSDYAQRLTVLRRTLHEVVTIASLVEGETRLASERARVAGVYYNRLARGMRLEADPTIQYIIPDGPRRLYLKDLRIPSPYNTYLRKGLPPGPINNPGREALYAAFHPESHEYLYFVATGTGGHTFSHTYEDHMKAVRAYRRTMQNREER